jgi:hypothetical protein
MSDIEILSELINVVKSELSKNSEVKNTEVKIELFNKSIKCSWSLHDDVRQNKRTQTIHIKLHSDFSTSEFSKNSLSIINEEFVAFMRNKLTNFMPNPAQSRNEPPPKEFWIFPTTC